MPKIPSLTGPSIQETGMPNIRSNAQTNADTFGGGASFEAAAQKAINFSNIVQEEKQKADQLVTLDAVNKLRKAKTKLFYDPDTGALNVKGKDSLALPDSVGTDFDANADEIENSLSNDYQKSLFRKSRQEHRADLDDNISKHVFSQMGEYRGEVFTSALKIEEDEAQLNYKNEGKLMMGLGKQQELIEAYAAQEGKSPEWVANTLAERKTSLHAGVVTRALNNNEDEYAEAYFKKYSADMNDADQVGSLEQAIAQGTIRGKAQRMSDEIMKTARSESEARRLIKDMAGDNPKVREALEARVASEFNFKDQELQKFRRENFLGATNLVETATKQGLMGQKALDSVPPNQWSQLSLSERNALEGLAAGKQTATNPQTYYSLNTLASVKPEEFLKKDLMDHIGELSSGDFQEMVKLQTGLRNKDPEAMEKLDGFRTDSQIILDSLTEAGFDNKDDEEAAMARKKAEVKFAGFVKENKRKPNNLEMQKIADDLMKKKVTQKGWFWDTEKHVFEMTPKEIVDTDETTIEQIPASELTQIQNFLKANKKKSTPEAVLQFYKLQKASR